MESGQPDRRLYETAVFAVLRDRLRSGDIWVEGSRHYRAVEDQLLPRPLFAAMREAGPLPVAVPESARAYLDERRALLARRLHALLSDLLEADVPLGELDISFYRDDVATRADQPVVHASHVEVALEGRTVVIVDDVLYTGRTVRAAIEALFDYGRPARVQLAVLADRGHRELPIRPDYVGKNLPTALS